MNNTITIGKTEEAKVTLDVDRLIKTRLLVTANSGGGKSWLLRLLFEQLGKTTPLIVIDREGEFVTLREKLDVVIAGPHGEIPTDVRSASLLCRRLMERRLSAVIDMSELPLGSQRKYVRSFLETLVGLPKELWGPRFIGLDETHLFAPERGAGEAESLEAVVNLATLGRKRGFSPIFATQRISKLHKDAAAELLNKFIGRTNLDVDQQRAADELGMGRREAVPVLREMSPPGSEGEFFGFGPAMLLPGVTRFRVDKVSTTHPEAGQGRMIEAPKASKAITAVLKELTDLPQQAEAEIKDIAAARNKIADLQRQLKAAPIAKPNAVQKTIERYVLKDGQIDKLDALMARQMTIYTKAAELANQSKQLGDVIAAALQMMRPPVQPPKPVIAARAALPVAVHPAATKAVRGIGEQQMTIGNSGKRRLMVALAQNPGGLTDTKLSLLTGISKSGGTWRTYMGELRGMGWIGGDRSRLLITEQGVTALGDYEPLPTGDALIDYWRNRLGGSGKRSMFDAAIAAYPSALSYDEMEAQTGISQKGGTWRTYLGELRGLELLKGKGEIRACDDLFQ